MFKFGAEVKDNALENKDSEKKDKMSTALKCDQCDYKAQKLNTFRKYLNSKYTEQKGKVCRKEFKASMQFVSHVANEHIEEEEWNVEFTSTPKNEGSG